MANGGEALGGLDTDFRQTVITLMASCTNGGFRIVPYDGSRSPWDQAIYWRQSRTKTEIDEKIASLVELGAPYIAGILQEVGPHSGKHVTNAIPGQSFHQYRRALDSYIESPDTRRALWRDAKLDGDEYALAVRLYDKFGTLAEAAGLTWGGRWSIGDFGHIQSQRADSPLREFGSWPALDHALKDAWPHA